MALDMTRNRLKRKADDTNNPQQPAAHSNNSTHHEQDRLSLSLEPSISAATSTPPVATSYHSHANHTDDNIKIATKRIDSLSRLKKSPFKHFKTIFLIVIGSGFFVIRFSEFLSMQMGIILTTLLILGIAIFMFVSAQKQQKRFNYIKSTPFPANIWKSEALRDLPLEMADKMLIREGLRDFFLLHALKPNRPLSMPSKYVDKLWHAFILDTHNYQNYCMQAFGKVLHHVPDYAFHDNNRNIRMYTYQAACRLQNINPAYPRNQVPRLFAIDTHVNQTLGITATLGAVSLAVLMSELSQSYIAWYMLITSISPSSDNGFIEDAEIDEDGDASCGSSDGGDSDCGGGCGGD